MFAQPHPKKRSFFCQLSPRCEVALPFRYARARTDGLALKTCVILPGNRGFWTARSERAFSAHSSGKRVPRRGFCAVIQSRANTPHTDASLIASRSKRLRQDIKQNNIPGPAASSFLSNKVAQIRLSTAPKTPKAAAAFSRSRVSILQDNSPNHLRDSATTQNLILFALSLLGSNRGKIR